MAEAEPSLASPAAEARPSQQRTTTLAQR